jgi:hypothetical protein
VLIYEGHDAPKLAEGLNPKTVDQPMYNPTGSLTQKRALLLYSLSSIISGTRNDSFMALAAGLSAILANLAYAFTSPYSSVAGSSGLVSAFLSGTMIFAFLGAWAESTLSTKTIQSVIGTFFF